MKKSEIISKAKHFFGKDRSFIKELVLSYEFKGRNYRKWKKEFSSLISHPNKISFGLFDDVIQWINDNQIEHIDWNWIGDLSWKIDIILNPNINKAYDWDKKLALKCKGTTRILTVFISDVMPCYTYDGYYMTYDKEQNFYEFGPLFKLTNDEKRIIKKIAGYLQEKGFVFIEKALGHRKFNELYSDTHSDGNASLFDVLFSDVNNYTTEIKRFSDKDLIEKSGQTFHWTEYYNKNGSLKKRIESRRTICGDYYEVVFDNKGQIIQVEVTRNKIGRKKHRNFKLDIIKTFNQQEKLNKK